MAGEVVVVRSTGAFCRIRSIAQVMVMGRRVGWLFELDTTPAMFVRGSDLIGVADSALALAPFPRRPAG